MNTSAGTGVYGLSESGYGVRGGSTSGIGIYGSSLDSHGISGSTSEATYSGVRGYTYTAGAYGVTGKSYSSGAAGFFEGTSGPGVKAESAGTGLADSTITAENTGGGIAFWAKTDSTDIAAAFSNEGTGALIKGFGDDGGGHEFIVQNDGSVWTEGDIGADGDIQTDGRLYTGASPPTADYSGGTYTMSLGDIGTSDDVIVDDDIIVGGDARIDGTIYGGDGGLATMVEVDGVVRTFHVDESAQDMLSDRGSGRLIAGEATILLDPAYADSIRIDNARPLLVQLTPTSECMGLYVYATSGDGFTVRELAGGDSDATFDWEVSAFRKGGIMGRMPSATANLATVIAD